MFIFLAGSGCRSNPRVWRPPHSPTEPERDLVQDGAADGKSRGSLAPADRQRGKQITGRPQEHGDPLHQFNTDVKSPVHVALSDGQICATCTCARNPQYAVFQRAQAFVLSVSISFPLLSGMLFSLRIGFLSTSFNRWAHSLCRPLWSWPPGLSSTHLPDIRPLRLCALWIPAQLRVYLIVWPTVCRPCFVLLGLFSVYLQGVWVRTPGAFSSFCLYAHC